MAGRTPTSILMLIDSRNRLEGELKKLAALKRSASELHETSVVVLQALDKGVERLAVLKRSASELHDTVSAKFQELDKGLAELSGDYEPQRIRTVRSLRTIARGQYGLLTRTIFTALKAAGGVPLATDQVFKSVAALWPTSAARPDSDLEFRLNMRRRLRGLRSRGLVLSPEVSRGGDAWTTWMINPAILEHYEDNLSTLVDDDCPGSSRRKMPKDQPA